MAATLFFAVAAMALLVVALVINARKNTGRRRWLVAGAIVVCTIGAGLISLAIYVNLSSSGARSYQALNDMERVSTVPNSAIGQSDKQEALDEKVKNESQGSRQNFPAARKMQNVLASANGILAGKALIEGAVPVHLQLPSYDHHVRMQRELVNPERPLRATLVYVTQNALIPLLLMWLAAIAMLLYTYRSVWPKMADKMQHMWKQAE